MSKTLNVSVTNNAANMLQKVQDRMTEIRRKDNPAASAANQPDAVSWILENTLLLVTNDAANMLQKVQDRMTEIRRKDNPAASAANQLDAVSWILENTLLPVTL
jgi:hypothetical protein